MDEPKTTSAGQVRWDLSDLYSGREDPRLSADLEESLARAEALGGRLRGRVASLSPAELAAAVAEYEAILEQSGRAGTFAYLDWSTGTEDPARGALLARLQEHSSQLHQRLLFLELEWAQVDEERARELLASPDFRATASGSCWPAATARTCSPSRRRRSWPRRG